LLTLFSDQKSVTNKMQALRLQASAKHAAATGRVGEYDAVALDYLVEEEEKERKFRLDQQREEEQADRARAVVTDDQDEGYCLSMHQPWASLLVAGIKRLEGRGWPSSHRGRLWIASTAQPVDPVDVEQTHAYYEQLYGSSTIPFPKSYPSSALLGCVEMTECLSHEELGHLRQQHPRQRVEENESLFVFACKNPRMLRLKQRISGKHKIFRLDHHMHKAISTAGALKNAPLHWRTKILSAK
jgi:hypothetical protein